MPETREKEFYYQVNLEQLLGAASVLLLKGEKKESIINLLQQLIVEGEHNSFAKGDFEDPFNLVCVKEGKVEKALKSIKEALSFLKNKAGNTYDWNQKARIACLLTGKALKEFEGGVTVYVGK